MGIIKQLDDNLSNLIAAGEVVVNMASVVKELVENSIDAASTKVRIDLKESGLEEIKVSDDGSGMSLDDMNMCIKRHATSKIKTQHDLFHITSLGFRGEAIPSIASVSHLEIISSDGEVGHKLLFKNGKKIEQQEYAPTKGTVMTVRYLFYNTPARLKHLKSESTELSYIVEYINKIALSNPNISFILTNNQKTLFHSNGNGDVLKVLSNIYNIDIIKNMIPFEGENQYFKIKGFLTKPMFYRSQRTHITVIANQRMIKNSSIIKAVLEAYKTYLPIGKFPIVFLNIELDPLLIDVNVHPQKLEVKFTEERMLKSLITSTVHRTLQSLTLIPEMKEVKKVEVIAPTLDLHIERKEEKQHKEIIPSKPFVVKEESPLFEMNKESNEEIVIEETVETKEIETVKRKIPYLNYIGQYMGTYLLAQNEEGLYIIDQHAAAERIRYENYRKKFGEVKILKTTLLIPIKLHLSNSEVLLLQSKMNDVTEIGLEIKANEEYGIDIIKIPSWIPKGFELSYVEEIVQYLIDEKEITVTKLRDNLAKNLSCKHSIKANKYINLNEINVLLDDLSKCDNPYTCPHGRPVIIKWTQTEIEKMFKRIM